MSEITYEIVKTIGIISENEKTGWKKCLSLVAWNGGKPKFDIREWSPDPKNRKMSRGVTLTEQEMQQIVDLYRDFKYRK